MKLIANNLTTRVITSAILIPIIIAALMLLPQLSFGIVSAFILLLASTEWPRLCGKDTLYDSMGFVCLLIFCMGLGLFIIQITGHNGWVSILYFIFALALWVMLFNWILYYERHKQLPTNNSIYIGLLGLLILLSCWLGLNIIRDVSHGKFFVLFFLVLIWGADSVAYFSGKHWGGAKITPIVSPNKTWAGVKGALVFSAVLGLVGAIAFPLGVLQRLSLIPISIITAAFSIIGDLSISAFKRQQNLKDTGSLLPGHGGLLDRIDSLTAASPIFALGLLLIGLH